MYLYNCICALNTLEYNFYILDLTIVQGPNLLHQHFPGAQFAGARFAAKKILGPKFATKQFSGAQFAATKLLRGPICRQKNASYPWSARVVFIMKQWFGDSNTGTGIVTQYYCQLCRAQQNYKVALPAAVAHIIT